MRSPREDVELRGDRLGVRASSDLSCPSLPPVMVVTTCSQAQELVRSIARGPAHSGDTGRHSTSQDQEGVYPVDDSYPSPHRRHQGGDPVSTTVGVQGLASVTPRISPCP